MTYISYVLLTLCAAISLSGCSTFHAISLVKGGETHVRTDEATVVPFELSGHMILIKGRINDSGRDYTFDIDMPGLSGSAAIRVLRKIFPEMKILVLST